MHWAALLWTNILCLLHLRRTKMGNRWLEMFLILLVLKTLKVSAEPVIFWNPFHVIATSIAH